MMYKILHKIFGWDYIAWRNFADESIARVHVDKDGTVFYWRYKCTKVTDKILSKDQVLWLTCPSSKYLKEIVRSEK